MDFCRSHIFTPYNCSWLRGCNTFCSKMCLAHIIVVGCRLHLGQTWHRKLSLWGLSMLYKKNACDAEKWLYLIFGLSFLPNEHVTKVFLMDVISLMPPDGRLFKFIQYIYKNITYLDLSTYVSTFAMGFRECCLLRIFVTAKPVFSYLFGLKDQQIST